MKQLEEMTDDELFDLELSTKTSINLAVEFLGNATYWEEKLEEIEQEITRRDQK